MSFFFFGDEPDWTDYLGGLLIILGLLLVSWAKIQHENEPSRAQTKLIQEQEDKETEPFFQDMEKKNAYHKI